MKLRANKIRVALKQGKSSGKLSLRYSVPIIGPEEWENNGIWTRNITE